MYHYVRVHLKRRNTKYRKSATTEFCFSYLKSQSHEFFNCLKVISTHRPCFCQIQLSIRMFKFYPDVFLKPNLFEAKIIVIHSFFSQMNIVLLSQSRAFYCALWTFERSRRAALKF
jgi:hypothetical protein